LIFSNAIRIFSAFNLTFCSSWKIKGRNLLQADQNYYDYVNFLNVLDEMLPMLYS
jgi:hypothetical protein